MPVVYLIRHAQASFGDGSYDVLSSLGERQSALIGASLNARGIDREPDHVVSGTLRRQRDTALRSFPLLDGGLAIDARWNEYDTASVLAVHGAFPADQPHTELGAPAGIGTRGFQALLDPALEAWVTAGEQSTANETWPAFRQRALDALEELAHELGSGENGIAFTSGGVIGAICMDLLGGPGTMFVALNRVSINGAITKIIYGRGGPRLVSFNDHAHLESGDRELMTFR